MPGRVVLAIGMNGVAARWSGPRGAGCASWDGPFAVSQEDGTEAWALHPVDPAGAREMRREREARQAGASLLEVLCFDLYLAWQQADPRAISTLADLLLRTVVAAPGWVAGAPDPALSTLLVLTPLSAPLNLAQAVERRAVGLGWSRVAVRTDVEALAAGARLRGVQGTRRVACRGVAGEGLLLDLGDGAHRRPRLRAAVRGEDAPPLPAAESVDAVLQAGWTWTEAADPDVLALDGDGLRLGLRMGEGLLGDPEGVLWLEHAFPGLGSPALRTRASVRLRGHVPGRPAVLCLVRGVPGMHPEAAGVVARVPLSSQACTAGRIEVTVRTGPDAGREGRLTCDLVLDAPGQAKVLALDLQPLVEPLGWPEPATARPAPREAPLASPAGLSLLAVDIEAGEALVAHGGEGEASRPWGSSIPTLPVALGADAARFGWRCAAPADAWSAARVPWDLASTPGAWEGWIAALLEGLYAAHAPWLAGGGHAAIVVPYAWPLAAHAQVVEALEAAGLERALCLLPHEAVAALSEGRVRVRGRDWALDVQSLRQATGLRIEVLGHADEPGTPVLDGLDVQQRLAGALQWLRTPRAQLERALQLFAVVAGKAGVPGALHARPVLDAQQERRGVVSLRRDRAREVRTVLRHGPGPRAPWTAGPTLAWPADGDSALLEAVRDAQGALRLRLLAPDGTLGDEQAIPSGWLA